MAAADQRCESMLKASETYTVVSVFFSLNTNPLLFPYSGNRLLNAEASAAGAIEDTQFDNFSYQGNSKQLLIRLCYIRQLNELN